MNFAKNEHSFLTPVPRSLADAAIFQMSRHAALVGIEAPPGSTQLDIKPFAIMDVTQRPPGQAAHLERFPAAAPAWT